MIHLAVVAVLLGSEEEYMILLWRLGIDWVYKGVEIMKYMKK
jgi:hypothetical protein